MPQRRVLIDLASRGYGAYLICLGAAVLIGGDVRFSAPSFVAARMVAEMVSDKPHLVWAAVFITAGVLALVDRTRIIGLFAGAASMAFFSIIMLTGLKANPQAGVTGIVTYGFLAVMAAGLIAVRKHV